MRIVIELDPRVSEHDAERLAGHLGELLGELDAFGDVSGKHVVVAVGVDS